MRAARLFFFGGSCSAASSVSVDGPSLRLPLPDDPDPSERLNAACTFSSTLAAGVSGISDGRFIGTIGGDKIGSATEVDEGVDSGVMMLEFAIGTE